MLLPSAMQLQLLLLLLRPTFAQLTVQSGAPWPASAFDGARTGLSSATGPTETSKTPLLSVRVPGCYSQGGTYSNTIVPGPVVDAAGDVYVAALSTGGVGEEAKVSKITGAGKSGAGTVVWTATIPDSAYYAAGAVGNKGFISGSMALGSDGNLYAATTQGNVAAIAAATGAIVWVYRPGANQAQAAGVTIGNGVVVIGTYRYNAGGNPKVVALRSGASAATVAWSYQFQWDYSNVGSIAYIASRNIFAVATGDCNIYAIVPPTSGSTATLGWPNGDGGSGSWGFGSSTFGCGSFTSPDKENWALAAAPGGDLYATSAANGGSAVRIDAATGKTVWKWTTKSTSTQNPQSMWYCTAPAITATTVVWGCNDWSYFDSFIGTRVYTGQLYGMSLTATSASSTAWSTEEKTELQTFLKFSARFPTGDTTASKWAQSGPAVGADGSIYAVSSKGDIYSCIGSTAAACSPAKKYLSWSFASTLNPNIMANNPPPISATPAIGLQGVLYSTDLTCYLFGAGVASTSTAGGGSSSSTTGGGGSTSTTGGGGSTGTSGTSGGGSSSSSDASTPSASSSSGSGGIIGGVIGGILAVALIVAAVLVYRGVIKLPDAWGGAKAQGGRARAGARKGGASVAARTLSRNVKMNETSRSKAAGGGSMPPGLALSFSKGSGRSSSRGGMV